MVPNVVQNVVQTVVQTVVPNMVQWYGKWYVECQVKHKRGWDIMGQPDAASLQGCQCKQ